MGGTRTLKTKPDPEWCRRVLLRFTADTPLELAELIKEAQGAAGLSGVTVFDQYDAAGDCTQLQLSEDALLELKRASICTLRQLLGRSKPELAVMGVPHCVISEIKSCLHRYGLHLAPKHS